MVLGLSNALTNIEWTFKHFAMKKIFRFSLEYYIEEPLAVIVIKQNGKLYTYTKSTLTKANRHVQIISYRKPRPTANQPAIKACFWRMLICLGSSVFVCVCTIVSFIILFFFLLVLLLSTSLKLFWNAVDLELCTLNIFFFTLNKKAVRHVHSPDLFALRSYKWVDIRALFVCSNQSVVEYLSFDDKNWSAH